MERKISLFLIIFSLALIAGKGYSETIGLQKTITLPDRTTGNFITTGQIVFQPDCYQDTAGNWKSVYKVELQLYKSRTVYDSGAEKMQFRYEVQIDSDDIVLDIDSIYNYILTVPYFEDAVKVER